MYKVLGQLMQNWRLGFLQENKKKNISLNLFPNTELNFIFQSLASRLSQSLNISEGYCVAAINELQTNAIDKLKARDLFRESGKLSIFRRCFSDVPVNSFFECMFILGLATLKVRVPGKSNGGRLITVQTKLDSLAEELYQQVGSKLEVPSTKFVQSF